MEGRPCPAGGWDQAQEASRLMMVARREGHAQPGIGGRGAITKGVGRQSTSGCRSCLSQYASQGPWHLWDQVILEAPPRPTPKVWAEGRVPMALGAAGQRWGSGVTGFLCRRHFHSCL